MASYSAVGDSELAVNKPMTSSLWFRIRDNPLAIFEQLGWATTASAYTSPEQTVSSAGTFTLNHGLTVSAGTDIDISTYMICKVNDVGYTANDVVAWNPAGVNTSGVGNSGAFSVILTTTQIIFRFGSGNGASPLALPSPTTGVLSTFVTPANWKIIIKARG